MTKKPSAGMRDLSAAVAMVHAKPDRKPAPAPPSIDPQLLLAGGDAPGRPSYFEHDDGHAPVVLVKKPVHLVMGKRAVLYDYRTDKHCRTHRAMVTIPPKVRENIRALFGAEEGDEFAVTTALVALADYAAMVLIRDGKRLHVSAAPDPDALARAELRALIRQARTIKSGPSIPQIDES